MQHLQFINQIEARGNPLPKRFFIQSKKDFDFGMISEAKEPTVVYPTAGNVRRKNGFRGPNLTLPPWMARRGRYQGTVTVGAANPSTVASLAAAEGIATAPPRFAATARCDPARGRG